MASQVFLSPAYFSRIFKEETGRTIQMPCGGRGSCQKCRVIATGGLSELCEIELTALSADIGTTTVVAYLYHLPTGVRKATASLLNPQASYGADVISRLQASHEGEGKPLTDAICGGLQWLVDELVTGANLSLAEIDSMVVTGNTAMLYLLTGRNPESIIAMPFHPDCYFGEWIAPEALNLNLPNCKEIYLTRCISAYVGGDITSSCLAAQLEQMEADSPTLLCDIGTNGEMVLAAGGKFYGCSTAAGPTFEGAGIHHGMTAQKGAIYKVTCENNTLVSHVIGGGEAVGICGTGIIDAVAGMLALGVIDETGYMAEDDHPLEEYMTEVGGDTALMLPGTQIAITQRDIRAVQLTKSAICAGMLTLLKLAGLEGKTVPFLIAGGFGSVIDVQSAERIGLIPEGFASCSTAMGNGAGMGASMMLLSRESLQSAEKFSRGVETAELATDPYFIQCYTEGMLFPER